MGKIRKTTNNEEKKTFLVAQDMKLVRALAGNDKRIRAKALKNLKKWFEQRTTRMPFTNDDFLRIWKGLYYAMWMSDKPLIQEECAENIAKLVHFPTPDISLQFFKCGLIVITTEWFGIDQWRMNKFLMFVRRILRQGLEVLKKNEWDLDSVAEFGNILLETVLKKENSTHLGCTMHFTEIFMEELAKVSNGEIDTKLMTEFLRPFIKYLSTLNDDRQINHIQKFMFHHLMDQSDEGIEYENKFEAWKERGFPEGSMNCMQKVESGNDEEPLEDEIEKELNSEEKPMDPRAGQVHVILPQLKFDALEISQLLHESKFAEGSTTKARKTMTKLENEFKKLSEGNYPFGFKKIRLPAYDGYSTKLRKSVNRLVKFEKKLLNDNSKNRKRKNGNILSTDAKKPKLDSVDFFQNKLQEFIEKSEGKLKNGTPKNNKLLKSKSTKVLKPKTKKPLKQDYSNWTFEDHFRRNSGTWIVHRFNSSDDSISKLSDVSNSPNMSVEVAEKSTTIEKKAESPNTKKTKENCTPQTSPRTRRKSEPLFSQSEWDEAPKEGEVEIFVPSNKFKKKMELRAQKQGKNLSVVLNNSLNKLVKTRYSLDSSFIKNPYAKNNFQPKSEKKVKIALKLNKSQEIHEHQEQLRNSPAIPYDANKKPLKPLLKPNAGSPINPFYRKKLKL